MPDESRVVVARFNSLQKLKGRPQLEVSGWNIEALEIPLTVSGHGSGKQTGEAQRK